jgi:hypothetical protein
MPTVLVPQQLTVLTTSQCTARCDHCSMSSGPLRKEALTFEDIRNAVDQLRKIEELSVVIFAGGEPTLLGEQLLDSIAYVSDLGLLTRLVTNASWARSENSALSKIKQFREAGLHELNISADDYHLPYVPFENVVRAWNASKGVGFKAVVIANCRGPRSVITPSYIMDSLGEKLSTRYDEDGRGTPIAPPAPDGTVYTLSNANLQRLGRATVAVRSAALSPKNHLVACCGTEAEGNPILDFGSMGESTARELVDKADDNLIVNSIILFGPGFIKQYLNVRARDIPFRPRYASICELCEHIVKRPVVVEALLRSAPELAQLVLERRRQLGMEEVD